MNYTMKVCMGGSNQKNIQNISPEMIEIAIDNLIPVKYHFVILEAEEPIQNCEFIQTLMEVDNAGKIRYLVETCFLLDENKIMFSCYTKKSDEVKNIFKQYMLGIIPDITHWKDITKIVFPDEKVKRKKMDSLHELIEKAESGDPEAQYHAAFHILNEMELDEGDTEIINRALSFLRNSAMQGGYYGIAACELGELYHRGKYVEQNYEQAVLWYRTATQKLQPIGYYFLGICWQYGTGVPVNYAKAFDCYFKGAARYINNYIKLGDCFRRGLFVSYDPAFMFKLYTHALDSDLELYKKTNIFSNAYGEVCLRLGLCYLQAIGTRRDISKANYYFNEAKKGEVEKNRDSIYIDNELLNLLKNAPYSKKIASKAPLKTTLTDDPYISEYIFHVKHLLLNPEDCESYQKLAEIYSQTRLFERDPNFIDFCLSKSKKTQKQSQ